MLDHVQEHLLGYGGSGIGAFLFSIGIVSEGGGLLGFIIPIALWLVIGSIIASACD